MRGIGGSTLRGGQTVFHGIRMWGQLFQAAMLFAAFMTVAVPAWNLWRSTTGAEWYAAGMVTLAEGKLALGYDPDSGQEVRFADGTRRTLRIRDIAASIPAREARERIRAEMFASAWLGAAAGGGLIALFLVVFWYRGARLGRQKRIRGAEMVTAAELRRRLQTPHARLLQRLPGGKRLRPYSIAGIPYPERTETQHTIVSGTTGSGKTVLISDLVSQIRSKGERCVVYDKMGSYTRSFFDRDRDVLLNPLDARAPRWSPFFEARDPRDFEMMAAALIPQQKDTGDPFWVTAARQLFSNGAGVFWKQGVEDNRVLVDHLLKTELTELAEAMAGTVAQSIVDPENRKRRSASGAREAWTLGCDDTAAPLPAARARLAVLIDAENASPRDAGAVFEAAERLGEATVRRIYGDFSNGRLASWNAAIRRHSIVTCHQPAHARGKNAADIALVIDAMDAMYRERLDGWCLVTSDSDFTRLAQRLREGGFAVYGFGERKTPQPFRAACHRFAVLGKVSNGAASAPGGPPKGVER